MVGEQVGSSSSCCCPRRVASHTVGESEPGPPAAGGWGQVLLLLGGCNACLTHSASFSLTASTRCRVVLSAPAAAAAVAAAAAAAACSLPPNMKQRLGAKLSLVSRQPSLCDCWTTIMSSMKGRILKEMGKPSCLDSLHVNLRYPSKARRLIRTKLCKVAKGMLQYHKVDRYLVLAHSSRAMVNCCWLGPLPMFGCWCVLVSGFEA